MLKDLQQLYEDTTKMWRALNERRKNIYACRYMLWNMAVSQFKAKYSCVRLGIWLTILNPLLIMLAISFVFTMIIKLEIENFPLFALAGIFPWMFFTASLSDAVTSIVSQQSVLRQFNLPREILPLSVVLSNFFSFLIGWCVIYPIFVVFNPKIIFLLPLLVLIFLLTLFFICGLGVMFAVLNVISRDIGQLLGVLLMFWFWVTPIFYSREMIPEKFLWVCNLNPITAYTVFYRDILFRGIVPDFYVFLGVFIWAIISLISGMIVFCRYEPRILKRI